VARRCTQDARVGGDLKQGPVSDRTDREPSLGSRSERIVSRDAIPVNSRLDRELERCDLFAGSHSASCPDAPMVRSSVLQGKIVPELSERRGSGEARSTGDVQQVWRVLVSNGAGVREGRLKPKPCDACQGCGRVHVTRLYPGPAPDEETLHVSLWQTTTNRCY
jgi:hypothetical protein